MVDTRFEDFQEQIGKLKHLPRTGWVVRQVPHPETVASHSWRMALMAIQKEKDLIAMGVDVQHIIEMCLLHDVGESVVGDIIPEIHQTADKKISKEDKKKAETQAVKKLAAQFAFPKLDSMFLEYEEQKTPEAQLVKNLDKLDMILQAYEYLTAYPELTRLQEFMTYNEKDVDSPVFLGDIQEIKRRQNGRPPQKNDFIDYQIMAGQVKHLPMGMNRNDTVAEHSFRAAVTALYLETDLAGKGLSSSAVIKILVRRGMAGIDPSGNIQNEAEVKAADELDSLESLYSIAEFRKQRLRNSPLSIYPLSHSAAER